MPLGYFKEFFGLPAWSTSVVLAHWLTASASPLPTTGRTHSSGTSVVVAVSAPGTQKEVSLWPGQARWHPTRSGESCWQDTGAWGEATMRRSCQGFLSDTKMKQLAKHASLSRIAFIPPAESRAGVPCINTLHVPSRNLWWSRTYLCAKTQSWKLLLNINRSLENFQRVELESQDLP